MERRKGDVLAARQALANGFALSTPEWWAHWQMVMTDALVEFESDNLQRAEDLVHDFVANPGESKWTYLAALYAFGLIAGKGEASTQATRLLAAADRVRREMEIIVPPQFLPLVDRAIADVQDALGGEAFDEAWREGAALPSAEAITYARRGRGERKRPAAGWDALRQQRSRWFDSSPMV